MFFFLRASLGVDCEFSLSSIKLLGIANSESVVLSNYFPHILKQLFTSVSVASS